MLLKNRAEDEFQIETIVCADVDALIDKCARIYQGRPDWVDVDDHIKTVNFAKVICSETARLATLGIGIHVDGSKRAEWLQGQIEKIYFQLRHWVESGCAYGTVILKPNGQSVDLYVKGNFEITHQTGGVIDGVVFMDQEKDSAGKKHYTRLEYHRFVDGGLYAISNRCYVGSSPNDCKRSIDIKQTPWAELEGEVLLENVGTPLFGVLRMPHANNLDISSPYALPIFSDAIEELKDLDIAYSRNAKEVKDSKRTVLLDSDRLLPTSGKIENTAAGFEARRKELKLPDYIKSVYGSGTGDFYHEINPELRTDERLTGINALLSQIGFKVGFSNGYFVFNEKTGMITATQVESDDRRTIQLIKDVRDKLEDCLNGLIHALNAFADLYDLAPVGDYEVVYDFGDITYNQEEDRARWYSYVVAGKIPFWFYLTKFEGMTEKEAKELAAEAQPKTPALFGGEE